MPDKTWVCCGVTRPITERCSCGDRDIPDEREGQSFLSVEDYKKSGYSKCPYCGTVGAAPIDDSFDFVGGRFIQTAYCGDCKQFWNEVFELVALEKP